jgi:TRAP-type uncharacterized transport system substrate-binding protein
MGPELVYKTMEAFSGHLDEAHVIPVQLKDTLTLKNAAAAIAGGMHPGAARYWKERGIEIKKPLKFN